MSDVGAPEPRPTLVIEDLVTEYYPRRGTVRAVDGISLRIGENECVALVGESGSGKSATAMSVMRLLPPETSAIVGGALLLDGVDLLGLDEKGMRAVRGRDVTLVPQDPATSLNPLFRIEAQISNTLRLHLGLRKDTVRAKVLELLESVAIGDPERCARAYPHELSGGMRQRVAIAMALATKPKLLIADEPTTALDVTVQRQVVDLMSTLRRESGTAMLFITHDLSLAAEISDRVAVMYAGRIVEVDDTRELITRPRHPYTQGLVSGIPRPGRPRAARLEAIPGAPPPPLSRPPGCRFVDRCPHRREICGTQYPPLVELSPHGSAACWVAQESEPATRTPVTAERTDS